tara:strand:- start:214 stop:942 length:729 start_codon:yes stop_codon:yes gene_type:complete
MMQTNIILAKGLIIDDDKNVHEILSEGLPMYKFSSSYAIEDTKTLLKTESFAFILLDYRLGTQKTGLSLVSTIKHYQPLAIIALMSAYGTPFVLKEAIDSQIDTFLDKPIILQAFEKKLTDILSKKGLLNTLSHTQSVSHIEEMIQDSNQSISAIQLNDYAKQNNKSYKYLSQKFKKETGKTFQQLKKEEKYNTIKNLLIHTTLSIKDISIKTGFKNPSAIMRGFKDFTGQTMSAFRKNNTK